METGDIRLNLGSGDSPDKYYTNVDIRGLDEVDVVADIRDLPYKDNSVAEIKSKNTIEHFGRHEITSVLKEWVRVLKPGGTIILETVDMGKTMTNWKWIPYENLLDAVLGAQTYPENFHKMIFTKDSLTKYLEESGCEVERVEQFELREIPRIIIKAVKK